MIFFIDINIKFKTQITKSWVLRVYVALLFTNYFFTFNTQFAGGYREVEIPRPIPNLEVKHFIADNTTRSPWWKRKSLPALSNYFLSLVFDNLWSC